MPNNIEDFLKNTDPKKLEDAIKKAQTFSSTPMGKKIMSELSGNSDLSGVHDAKTASEYIKQNPDVLNKLMGIIKNN